MHYIEEILNYRNYKVAILTMTTYKMIKTIHAIEIKLFNTDTANIHRKFTIS